MDKEAPPPCICVQVATDDFDAGVQLQALYGRSSATIGAVVSFIGLVRDRHGDERIDSLELEHYPEMTERSIADIVVQAGSRWPLQDVVVIHRVGKLLPADQIVYVQVASAHRDAAFAGAQFIMDYLKTDAIFWKREARRTGASWIEATGNDRLRRQGWQAGKNT